MRVPGGVLAFLAVALAVGACDDDAGGPGTLQARVDPGDAAVGAAVVEVSADGVQGFEAAGQVRMYSGETSGGRFHRVVLVGPRGGGELRFRIRVEDVSADPLPAYVVAAADTANRPIVGLSEMRVRLEP